MMLRCVRSGRPAAAAFCTCAGQVCACHHRPLPDALADAVHDQQRAAEDWAARPPHEWLEATAAVVLCLAWLTWSVR